MPASLLAIIIHEVCHGLMARALGDKTAENMGRLSLNPIKHVDIVGLIMLIVAGFGWAKPVPVDIRNFKKPKRDFALVALAGPISNFLLSFISVLCVRVTLMFDGIVAAVFFEFFSYLALRSAGLGIFNLFPIPPLDGSKVLGAFLPDKIYYTILRFERYGIALLMLLVFLDVTSGPISYLLVNVLALMYNVVSVPIPQAVKYAYEQYSGQGITPARLFEIMRGIIK